MSTKHCSQFGRTRNFSGPLLLVRIRFEAIKNKQANFATLLSSGNGQYLVKFIDQTYTKSYRTLNLLNIIILET